MSGLCSKGNVILVVCDTLSNAIPSLHRRCCTTVEKMVVVSEIG